MTVSPTSMNLATVEVDAPPVLHALSRLTERLAPQVRCFMGWDAEPQR